MAERYSRLYSLPERLYTEGAPVMIAAGALLKDSVTNHVIVQLKFQSVSAKKIKALTVKIYPKDVVGAPLGEAVEHQYLDLTAGMGQEFAQKSPILLPDNTAREFSAIVTKVIFIDKTQWESNGAEWSPLAAPMFLEQKLQGAELVKEYRLAAGKDCRYFPARQSNLWTCTCGAWNHEETEDCFRCGKQQSTLMAITLDELTERMNDRLKMEAEAAEAARIAIAERAAQRKVRRAKQAKVFCVVLAVLAVLGAAIAWFATAHLRVKKEAQAYADAGDYVSAVAVLDAFGKPEKTDADRATYTKKMEAEIQKEIEAKDYPAALALIEEYSVLDTAERNISKIQSLCKHPNPVATHADCTCVEDGYDRETCGICGHVEEKLIKAPGHEYSTEVLAESTCTEHGSVHLTCVVCNESHTEEAELLPHAYKTTINQKPTCTETGNATNVCSVCGNTAEEFLPAEGHHYGETILQAPTCTTDGRKQTGCTLCGDKSETVVMKATGHTWKAATYAAPKTCSTCGMTEGQAIAVEKKPTGVTSIVFEQDTYEIYEGCTTKLKVKIYPENAIDASLTWTTSSPLHLTVSDKGVITGLSDTFYPEYETVTCTASNGVSASCRVKVKPPFSITLNGKAMSWGTAHTAHYGDQYQLGVSFAPGYTGSKNITLSIDAFYDGIASLDKNGVLKILAENPTQYWTEYYVYVTARTDTGISESVSLKIS